MSLKYPYVLLLMPLAFYLLYRGMASGVYQKVIGFPMSQRNFRKPSSMLLPSWLPLLFRCLALALAIFALARPQSSSSHTRRVAEGIEIVIALDVSQSMMIEDTEESDATRLQVAKETVKKFIAGRQDDRIGFVMFSGEGVTLCPPTLDYEVLQSSVDQAESGLLKDGTAIGEAIALSVNRLKDSSSKSRVIILITDGDSNMGAIAPLTAGDIAAGFGIKVYSIALGREGVVRYADQENFFGIQRKVYRQTNSSINPALLMKISEETGGSFFRAEDGDSLKRVFSEIDKLERTKVETKDRVLWEEEFQYYLLAALVFLLLDYLLRKTIFRVLPE